MIVGKSFWRRFSVFASLALVLTAQCKVQSTSGGRWPVSEALGSLPRGIRNPVLFSVYYRPQDDPSMTDGPSAVTSWPTAPST